MPIEPRLTQAPASIGRFRVDAVLGSGGMGEVYKAFDPTLQRLVAVKTVRPGIDKPEYLERLFREAQACARLRHPNVVTVHEAGEIDGLVYMVMEYLVGEDLAVVLGRNELSFEGKIRVLLHVLDALQHAHSEDVIHRDIKPSNVYRQSDGSIKLVDFGLARVTQIDALTVTGAVMATPHYASPEQLKGETVDRRTDIYSTGVLAYEMITGRRPFEGQGDSLTAVMLRVISDPPPPMNVIWTRTFPAIEQIVQRAMAKLPIDRYQTAAEMRQALADFLATSGDAIAKLEADLKAHRERVAVAETVTATPEMAAAAVVAAPAAMSEANTAASSSVPSQSVVKAPRSRTWVWIGLAAATAILAAIVFTNPRTAGEATPPSASGTSPATSPAGPAPPPDTGSISGAGSSASAPGAAPPSSTPAAPGPTPVQVASRESDTASAPPRLDAPAAFSSMAEAATVLGAKQLFAGTGGRTVNAGLRYRLTRQLPDGSQADVDPETTVFKSGERVRFAFDSNIDGYLYVVQQGSSGRWGVLFPSPEINGGRNAIRKTEEYHVPKDDWFLFDATPGTEQVFVFLSREALTQLPGFDRPVIKPETLVASVIENLQQRVQSRDLVFEKDKKVAGAGGAQATYVVNRSEVGQAVAASITLRHTP